MRLTYILAVMVVATLHASATALSSAKDPKATVKNGAAPGIVDSNLEEGGRLLRRVDNDYNDLDDDDLDDDDDYFEEERGGFGDAIKKLNPVTAAKKSAKKVAEQSAKAKETLKEAAEFQKMMERAKDMVYKNN